jgi:hypothetical protein
MANEAAAAPAGRALVGAATELADQDRLVPDPVLLQLAGVAGPLAVELVVVDADDVKRRPVDLLERRRGVRHRAAEVLANRGDGFGEERVEPLEELGPIELAAALCQVLDPLEERVSRDDFRA